MDYYIEQFQKKQDEFHEVIEKYPLFSEMIDEIYDKQIKEINDLIEKNDEYYLKKAIRKLEDVIIYIKDTSTKINEAYEKFDLMAKEWEHLDLSNVGEKELELFNEQIKKANCLIMEHDIKSILEANRILNGILKKVRK